MAATYELIDETKVRAEQTHESMVDAARRLRECKEELCQFENQAAVLSEGTPERLKLDFLIQTTRREIDDYRFLVDTGRISLDAGNTFLNHVEGNEW